MLRKCSFLALTLIFLASCTAGKNNPIVPSTTIVSTSEPLPPSTTPIPAKGAESGITIMGTVMDTSLSARIVMLKEPVEGLGVVALTDESELTSADGSEITLRDMRPGMTIQASGRPGESNALLASQVLVLDATPTPPPD
jgi:hypothetical protein